MDISQVKLSKTEWANTEIPVSENEKTILNLIKDGFHNINIRYNSNLSLFQTLKIAVNSEN